MSKPAKGVIGKSILLDYPMSCFSFSKKQFKKLSLVSSNFWLGDTYGQWKVIGSGGTGNPVPRTEAASILEILKASIKRFWLNKVGACLLPRTHSVQGCLRLRYFKYGEFLYAGLRILG
jgi:hypothetical protein